MCAFIPYGAIGMLGQIGAVPKVEPAPDPNVIDLGPDDVREITDRPLLEDHSGEKQE